MRSVLTAALRRLRLLFKRARLDDELSEEIDLHIELRRQALVDDGMDPREAGHAARRIFGNVTVKREEARDMWGLPALDTFIQDLRYGLRQLRRAPLFTCATTITLGLTIGANSALLAIANAVLFRPLPFPVHDRIVSISIVEKGIDVGRMDEPTARLALTGNPQTFASLAAYETSGANLTGGSQPERVPGARVSERFFHVMGVQPVIGRTFNTAELATGGPPAVILSDGLWTRAFGRDADVINRTVLLDDRSYAVVGVMPAGFHYPTRSEFWRPLTPRTIGGGGYLYTDVVGRLERQATAAVARDELLSLRTSSEAALPAGVRASDIRVMPLRQRLYGSFRQPLALLLGISACVLLVACANVANLLLARAAARRRELAVRAALGASRARLARQLLVESVLLASLGAVPGLLLAEVGLRSFVAFGPPGLAKVPGIAIDGTVLLLTFVMTVGTGLVFGLAPAFAARRADHYDDLKGTRSTGAASGRQPRRALVILELAAAVVLTIGAALLAKSFVRFQAVDRGFDADRVLTASVTLPRPRYADASVRRVFFNDVLERLRAMPAVESASLSSTGLSGLAMRFEWPLPSAGDVERFAVHVSTRLDRDHFRTFGIPILAGQDCSDARGEPTAVVSERMARRAFPGRAAVGQRLEVPGEGPFTIVGVVADVRILPSDTEPVPFVHPCNGGADAPSAGTIAVRVHPGVEPATLASAVRAALLAVDPAQPVTNFRTVPQIVSEAVTSRWFDALLIVSFAGIALVLGVFGLYAIVAYFAAQRTHELGVRMALGADRGDVLTLVLRQGAMLIGAGVLLGVAAALPLVPLFDSLLFQVAPRDMSVFIGASTLLSIIAIVATIIPAWRASRVDPLIALRAE